MANKNKNGYEDIWATPLNSKFELENSISAYIEINTDFVNSKFNEVKLVKVNPYVRFNRIFVNFLNYYDNFFEIEKKILKDKKIKDLTAENTAKSKARRNFGFESKNVEEEKDSNFILKNFKKNVENNVINYLRELDFISGTTVIDVICEKISKEIKNEVLGKKLKKYFFQLNREEQEYISLLVYNQQINSVNCMKNLKIGVQYFFYDSIIYKEKNQKNKIIIYINKEKNKLNIGKIKILELLFLELGLNLKVFWKNHFGVVNVDETVKIDEIAVF